MELLLSFVEPQKTIPQGIYCIFSWSEQASESDNERKGEEWL